jgi:hypothetical protein
MAVMCRMSHPTSILLSALLLLMCTDVHMTLPDECNGLAVDSRSSTASCLCILLL